MTKKLVFCLFSVLSLALLSAPSAADTVKLKSGQVHKGAVTAEEEDRIQLKLEGSGVRIWFQKDQIANLEKDLGKADTPKKETPAPEEPPAGATDDVIRAKELLRKLREQPELNNNQKPAPQEGQSSTATVEQTPPSGDPAEIEALIEKFRNGQFYDRLNACKKLGELGAQEAIPHLIYYLDDENVKLREESNESLKKITGKNFGFKATDNRNVRLWAIDKWKDWYEAEKKKDSSFTFKSLW